MSIFFLNFALQAVGIEFPSEEGWGGGVPPKLSSNSAAFPPMNVCVSVFSYFSVTYACTSGV